MQIGLMATCLGDVIRPAAPQAVVRILRRLGHEVVFPTAQTCCGQPMFNSGFADLAREQARHTIRVFETCETIVTPSGSCAAMVKVEYPHLLHDDLEWRPRAEALATRTFEFTDFLANRLGVVDVGARFEGKIAYHFACHLRMLACGDAAERLLQHVQGATLVPLARQDQCCGFGGSFAIRYPEISGSLVDDKMNCVLASGADVVVSTDTGCLMNIGGRLHRAGHAIRVEHIAEFLDRATPASGGR
jgi:L-lactate dehydrogenase complex protein LldE